MLLRTMTGKLFVERFACISGLLELEAFLDGGCTVQRLGDEKMTVNLKDK